MGTHYKNAPQGSVSKRIRSGVSGTGARFAAFLPAPYKERQGKKLLLLLLKGLPPGALNGAE